MVATENKPETVRIGKIDFTIQVADSSSDRTSREAQVEALANWLLAQWRLERGEGNS